MGFVKNFKDLPQKTKNLMRIGIVLALVVALPLFVWAITNLNFNQKERAASSEPIDITLGEPIIGLPSAAVTIVAYTDFQCPFCKTFVDDTFSTILANYPNDVKFVFKDFPILYQHPLAESAAIAGQCAFSQGKFWEMHDLIFAKQATLSTADLGSDFPYQLGLDMAVYNNCYSNKLTLAEVQDDMTEGSFKGVTGTPTFFIGSSDDFTTATKLVGALPFSSFKTVIDQILDQDDTTTIASASPTATATATSGTGGIEEGEPNSCGGTCGSNYNCKANLYCYQGFCRNPICSDDKDCNCTVSVASATATSKPTIKATSSSGVTTNIKSPTPKATASSTSAGFTPALIETNNDLPREMTEVEPENQFINKYAMYIFAGFIVLVATVLYFMFKKPKATNIPQILPPTNI